MLDNHNMLSYSSDSALSSQCFSHEKISSESIQSIVSRIKLLSDQHENLLSGLISMSGQGYTLDSFGHVLESIYTQSEAISGQVAYIQAILDSQDSRDNSALS